LTTTPPRTLGIIGAGKSGAALARLAVAAGLDVVVASSGSAADTAELLPFIAPGATAATVEQVTARTGLVVVATPLRRLHALPLTLLGGHVVVDVMNYWPPVDGVLPAFEDTDQPSSVVVQGALPASARLVKTFNHLGYHQMEDLARPAGAPDRAALAVAGDDADAVATVAVLVDAIGFDPVPAGPLAGSAALEPGTPVFGRRLDAPAMRAALGIADERLVPGR